MKNLIVLGMFVVFSLFMISCTCSREKKEKELSTWPQCSQEEIEKGTCGENGEKKVKGPRQFKLGPHQLTINRELLNRAFNEQVRGEKMPPTSQQVPPPQPATPQNQKDKPATSPMVQPATRPMFPTNKVRIPLTTQGQQEKKETTTSPEKGPAR